MATTAVQAQTLQPAENGANESDYEEGEFPSADEESNKQAAKRPRFVARLPAYCRVNPNLPKTFNN